MSATLEIATLHQRQSDAIQSPATEILYGGAAGGGKSLLVRIALILWCLQIPGLQAYLFRRTSPDLWKNHIDGPSGFPVLLGPMLESKQAVLSMRGSITWPATGSKIHLCHCQYEKDLTGYQGAEIHVLAIDELAQWPASMYRYLRSRVRLGSLQVPDEFRHLFPRILCGSNPGDIGHNWIKAAWSIGSREPFKIWRAEKRDGGFLKQYIPARLEDNPTIWENDPGYEDRLEGLGNAALVRALRHGDWNIVAGGMFDDLFIGLETGESPIVVPPFKLPTDWPLYCAFDWGSSAPFSVGWWTKANGETVETIEGREIWFPAGSWIQLAEWYGRHPDLENHPNEGLNLRNEEIAEGIKEKEQKLFEGRRVNARVADSQIWSDMGGSKERDIVSQFAECGIHWQKSTKGSGSRINGWKIMRDMLQAARDGLDKPGLYTVSSCHDWLRTIPSLPRNSNKPDDVDDKAEAHAGDMTRYMLTTALGEFSVGHWRV